MRPRIITTAFPRTVSSGGSRLDLGKRGRIEGESGVPAMNSDGNQGAWQRDGLGRGKFHEFVRLRVGGETFECAHSTLTNDAGSLFCAMLRWAPLLPALLNLIRCTMPWLHWIVPADCFRGALCLYRCSLGSLARGSHLLTLRSPFRFQWRDPLSVRLFRRNLHRWHAAPLATHVVRLSESMQVSDVATHQTDRDPQRFRVLLNFLRSRRMVLDGMDPEGILDECEYFLLPAAAEAAARLIGPKQGQELLDCFIDSRIGKLMSLQAGDQAVVRRMELNLERQGTIAVCAKMRAPCEGQGLIMAITFDGKIESSRVVQHEEAGGTGSRVLHAIAELDAGKHEISIMCETTTSVVGGGVGRFHISGPLRMEVWQYHGDRVRWEKQTDFARPGEMDQALVSAWTDGFGSDAAMLSEAVLAIAGSVYE